MDQTVTRAKLCECASETTAIGRADAANICERMFELIGEALASGETVKLTGFGSLQVRSRAERIGRNPRTGEQHRIAPHHTVTFVPGARLRNALENDPAQK